MPWLSDATPISKGRRVKQQSHGRASDRLGVIVHVLDILEVWRGTVCQKSPNVPPESSNTDQSRLHALGPTPTSSSAPRFESDYVDLDENVAPRGSTRRRARLLRFGFFIRDDQPAPPANLDDLGGDSDEEERWPRFQSKLMAAGVLSHKDDDNNKTPSAHVIDTLTDDQVDRLLFDAGEMASLFRTDPEERENLPTSQKSLLVNGRSNSITIETPDCGFGTKRRQTTLAPSQKKVERRGSTPHPSPPSNRQGSPNG